MSSFGPSSSTILRLRIENPPAVLGFPPTMVSTTPSNFPQPPGVMKLLLNSFQLRFWHNCNDTITGGKPITAVGKSITTGR